MNSEISLWAPGDQPAPRQADGQPPTLSRSFLHDWGKNLTAALAAHLVAIVCLFTFFDANPQPSPGPAWLEQVVVAQLAPVAQAVAAAPANAAPTSEVLVTTPAPTELAPHMAKKATAPPRPWQSPAEPPTKRSIRKALPPAAPTTSVPAFAAISPPDSSAGSPSPPPAVNRPGAETAVKTASATIQPKPINQPRPVYPAAARRRGLEGKVILHVTIAVDGAVRAVAVSHGSSYALLDEAAVASVWDWHFQPGQVGGQVQEMTISLPIDFRLR